MSDSTPVPAADLEARTRRKLDRQHFRHLIGADLTRIEPGRIEAALTLGPQHQQQRGFAHGGLVATMADLAAGFAASTLVPDGVGVVTSDLKVSYLNPGVGTRLKAVGWGAQGRPAPALLRSRSMVRRHARGQGLGHDGRGAVGEEEGELKMRN